jgi:23S rRNA pseudouridine1911/1915/1917 synthase
MTAQIFRIVFEDSSLLVIEKLRPFLSQKADKREGEGLFEFVSRALGYPLYPVHRLDREVLGLMIFGKTTRAADHLSEQFKNRSVRKVYEAVVFGKFREDTGTLIHYLKKNTKTNYVTVFPRPTPGAKRAELFFRVKETLSTTTKLHIELKTGRSHQIRVQLARIGHPIVGDSRYGKGRETLEEGIQLKAIELGVMHPETHESMTWSLI